MSRRRWLCNEKESRVGSGLIRRMPGKSKEEKFLCPIARPDLN